MCNKLTKTIGLEYNITDHIFSKIFVGMTPKYYLGNVSLGYRL